MTDFDRKCAPLDLTPAGGHVLEAAEALKAGRKLSRLVKIMLDGEEAPDVDA